MSHKNSNRYILIYSTVMVVIVALVLAFTSMILSDRKKANVENEIKEDLLMSVGHGTDDATVENKMEYIKQQYDKYIKESYVVGVNGERIESDNPSLAFEILGSLKKELAKAPEEQRLPVFVSHDDDGEVKYILPLWGSGLWGPIWGYMALKSDWATIYGAVFDHSGETPGLGAEISTPFFEHQFENKRVFNDGGKLVGITVTKVGMSGDNPYAVDGVSGGTITSRGVENMIKNNLLGYEAFIRNEVEKQQLPPPVPDPNTQNIIEEGDE